jgi:stage II sporulation protein R
MKRNIRILMVSMLIINVLFVGCTSIPKVGKVNTYNYNDVKDVLIRFHVIANSDTDADQSLKLKVRDEVINYLYPYLKESKSLDESRSIIKERENDVRNIALKVIKNNGYSYKVKTELSNENFPEKSYGNIILPQGNYEAFRVIIGNGQGQNWWCVMFPPLCFIDVTKGNVEEEESKEELDKEIDKSKSSKSEESPKVKFKIVEVFKEIFS